MASHLEGLQTSAEASRGCPGQGPAVGYSGANWEAHGPSVTGHATLCARGALAWASKKSRDKELSTKLALKGADFDMDRSKPKKAKNPLPQWLSATDEEIEHCHYSPLEFLNFF